MKITFQIYFHGSWFINSTLCKLFESDIKVLYNFIHSGNAMYKHA